jgi:RNA-directed DNA polymerase
MTHNFRHIQAYWADRQTRFGKTYWDRSSKLRYVAESQNWRCPTCSAHLFNGEELQTHHKLAVKDGGTDTTDTADNLIHLHKACHQHSHQMSQFYQLQEA